MNSPPSVSVGKCVVYTDCEPDDLLACMLLRKKNLIECIVCGEGHSPINKVVRIKNILSIPTEPADDQPTVLAGAPCMKDDVFVYEGHEMGELEMQKRASLEVARDASFINRTIKHHLAHGLDQFIIKPPRELFALWQVDEKITSGCRAFVYGSFNMRKMLDRSNPGKARDIERFFMSFKETYYFTTREAVGDDNNVRAADFPLFDRDNNPRLPKAVSDSIFYWNKFNMKDCEDTIEGIKKLTVGKMDPIVFDDLVKKNDFGPSAWSASGLPEDKIAQLKRNKKCFDQIAPEVATQFVGADAFLALSAHEAFMSRNHGVYSWKPCKLAINNLGYEEYKELGSEDKRNFFVIHADDKKEFRKMLVERLGRAFPFVRL